MRSKADTLEALRGRLHTAEVLPQICLPAWNWEAQSLKEQLEKNDWCRLPLIVRSSAYREDQPEGSLAGRFLSAHSVHGFEEICAAIEQVTSSYREPSLQDQVFIQPMLDSIQMSGVAFSQDPTTGAPYRVINYDDTSGSLSSVTSGVTNTLKTYYVHRSDSQGHPPGLSGIIALIEELEGYYRSPLDIEFAIDAGGTLFLLQVRPLISKEGTLSFMEHGQLLQMTEAKVRWLQRRHPYLHGDKTLLGVMPDWNPAEMIGIRPRPLARSLYQEMITDTIWAEKRAAYGYRDMTGFPLLINLHGLPYIDVRASFNSLIPADLDSHIAEKCVSYYLNKLEHNPHLHDKVEFEVVFSCFTFDLPNRLQTLTREGFSQEEISQITQALKNLTCRIFDREQGLYHQDLRTLQQLQEKFYIIQNSSLDLSDQIYWLVEDGKRFGSLPFAGLARAAFIAMQWLDSLVDMGIFSSADKHLFLRSLQTVCHEMRTAYGSLGKEEFLNQYGHLRPGTYDILSARYDVGYHDYFGVASRTQREVSSTPDVVPFVLTSKQIGQMNERFKREEIDHDAQSLLRFIREAIEGREYAKFLFSRNVSRILDLIQKMGETVGLSVEDLSYLDIQEIKKLYLCSTNLRSDLHMSCRKGKEEYALTKQLLLPSLIVDPSQVWAFLLSQSEPNYVTLQRARGEVLILTSAQTDIGGKIVMLSSADPGYDWIFTYPIAGLITRYGGVNSHMAIRALEMGIPAVIGAGELLYARWSSSSILEIDCENRQVRAIR